MPMSVDYYPATPKLSRLASFDHSTANPLMRNGWIFPVALISALAMTACRPASDASKPVESQPEETAEAMLFSGRLAMSEGSFSQAEGRLQRALERDPGLSEARQSLAEVLTMTGRRWESISHLFELLKQDTFQFHHLLMLADQDSVIDFSRELEKSLERYPDDPLPRLALARIARKNNDLPNALALIHGSLARNSDLLESHAVLGHLLVETDSASLPEWQKALPEGASEYPEIWHVYGRWAELRGDASVASRCYAETLLRNPNHRQATYRLSRLLRAAGNPVASSFEERAAKLDQLGAAADTLLRNADAATELLEAAQLTESLGRLWEAHAWYRFLSAKGLSTAAIDQRRREIAANLQPDTPLTVVDANPAARLDVASFPLPPFDEWSRIPEPDVIVRNTPEPTPPKFVDRAPDVGVNFSYDNGDDPNVPGWEIYNELGGGIAVTDLDGDAWPDLFFSQGTEWPPPPRSATTRGDRLFRNLGGSSFVDVSDLALPVEAGYGQGAAAGDFDNDGFPDLYVANIGGNRLYRNQGDGTYVDVTDDAGIDTELWTSSCLIADLNGDTLPDLYDVNYLAGDAPFRETCFAGGVRRACSPDRFAGEQDQLLINSGDGRFHNATLESGIVAADGKGLGVIAADFDGSRRLSLFVANDATPNHFFENRGSVGQPAQFAETGMAVGVAFDGEGRSEACMGIAFDDADLDGLWDLFVTNFHHESNTLYQQNSGGLFSDGTRRAGLGGGRLDYTGFGTQFVDVELNGLPDLIALNGHIDDLRHEGIPFQMKARVFANLGSTFREIDQATLGGYFQRSLIGRALACVDFDRDGRTDLAAMHLDAPVAILNNVTPTTNHFLKLRLTGTSSSRDAIGTVVECTTKEGKQYRKQLVAGDGYQVANERMLVFGVGSSNQIKSLIVRWPSGVDETFEKIDVDQEVRVIEGRGMFVLRAKE